MHHVRLTCPRCDATLVPAFTGMRCPRLTACGRGGYLEVGAALHIGTTWTGPTGASA